MKLIIMLIALVWLPFVNGPQNKFQISDNSTITIAGTSTLHDWTMDSKTVKGTADIELTGGEITAMNEVVLEIPVESLKSGKGAMDKNAYEAMNTKKYPTILFKAKGFDKAAITNGKSTMEVTGDLTIAGKTRTEKILVEYKTDNKGNLVVSGSKAIKMTDYGVTPPEVMFGTVKTGNDLNITFNIALKGNTSI